MNHAPYLTPPTFNLLLAAMESSYKTANITEISFKFKGYLIYDPPSPLSFYQIIFYKLKTSNFLCWWYATYFLKNGLKPEKP